MALSPTTITNALLNVRAAGQFPMGGPNFDTMAQAIGAAVASWGIGQIANVTVLGNAAGTIGTGTISTPTTRIFVLPATPLMTAELSAAGFQGQTAPSLATVVSLGISNAFTQSAQYSGTVAGVGTGQDVSRITVANPVTLIPILITNLNSIMGAGVLVPQLATGLANGITKQLLTGTGTGTVVGPAGSSPSTGISTSVLV